MAADDNEEKLLRSVALQNANTILLARLRAERELVEAKEALERKSEELARSLAMIRATLEATSNGILVTDANGNVTGFNQNFVELWQVPGEVMDMRKHAKIIELNSRWFREPEKFHARIDEIYSSSPPESFDLLELANGRVIERFSKIQFVEERNVGRVWSFRDVTERRRAENTLKEADKKKDEFLATLAHELRNPLVPIRNGLKLLKLSEKNGAEIEETRSVMEQALNQMIRLVDDLLDVSRITTGKLQLRKERVELAAVVQSALETSRPLIDEREHKVTVSLPEQSILLDADPVRLAQVFSNLLNNAAKYSEQRGEIVLSAEIQGNDVIVRVADRGIGIRAGDLPHIFDMFAQVDTTFERSEGGLGIGLSLVKRLVEMHGGRIDAHSNGLGTGSEFSVRLPVGTPSPSVLYPKSESETAASPAKRRILIVDDNRLSSQSTATLLRMMGHEVATANDGIEGVECARTFEPDVILMDIGLPQLNGYETAHRIRQESWGKEIFLMAVTGFGQEEDRRRALEAGFNHYFVKPVDLVELEKKLSELGVR